MVYSSLFLRRVVLVSISTIRSDLVTSSVSFSNMGLLYYDIQIMLNKHDETSNG